MSKCFEIPLTDHLMESPNFRFFLNDVLEENWTSIIVKVSCQYMKRSSDFWKKKKLLRFLCHAVLMFQHLIPTAIQILFENLFQKGEKRKNQVLDFRFHDILVQRKISNFHVFFNLILGFQIDLRWNENVGFSKNDTKWNLNH